MKTETAGVNRYSTGMAPAVLLKGATRTNRFWRLGFLVILFGAIALRSSAAVFTEDTEIGPLDTNYDGQDVVILDCTVSVDGPHTFSSLVLAANGVLTHSASTNGQLFVTFNVTNTPYVLSGNIPDLLANSNIISSLLLTDTNGDIYTNGADYLEINQTNGNYISTEIERTTTSSIPDGGTVLVSYSYDGAVPVGLDLTVTGIVWVTAGCEIDADGIGYGASFGPGAGSSSGGMFFFGSGGGYGGSGGMSLSNAVGGVCYGSLYQPAFPGSGGGASYAGNGGDGGGLVRITAGDEMEIDGVISANGENATNSRSGGGSGGGIWLSAPSLSGVGSISANGGQGAPDYGGGGGGGGRIAIICGTNNFAGTMTAYGGGGANNGGAGTVFTELTGLTGLLTLDNDGNPGANSTVTLPNSEDIAISNGAVLAVSGLFYPQNVTIGTNSILTGQPLTSLQFSASSLTVSAGGAISVNGLGFSVGGGLGAGGSYVSGGIDYGGGGGHGGYGAPGAVASAGGGIVSDNQVAPTGVGGSGGGSTNGGAGGGAIDINVSGTLQVNGLIAANGLNGPGVAGGGGAGGSVYLTAGTVSGDGMVTANGGNGANSLGGGGGGGRIAIVANNNIFAGTMNCFGGGGANYGGAGTVFSSQINAWQNLVLDNGGNTGPSTPVQSASSANLTVQDGAWGTLPSDSIFSNLEVGSNAWVTAPTNFEANTVTIYNNATFQAGGGLTMNSDGPSFSQTEYGSGGVTTTLPYAGGGGGNGGMGGAGNVSAVKGGGDVGGTAGFNQVVSPSLAGGNGGGLGPFSIGGIGGGTLSLRVDGIMLVNGVISANGGNGSGEGGGGGAGGSLNLNAGTLAGLGSITANGGNGANLVGGGGGGGCIAIALNNSSFNGTFSAFGGVGANDGGAGTIYIKTNSIEYGNLVVDNGGLNGAGSVVESIPEPTDLTLRDNGALYYASTASLSFGNLLITNASLIVSNFPLIINANNISVQGGGQILANAAGYAQNSGPGEGRDYGIPPYYAGSGGGNGGCGGMAISNVVAGGGGGVAGTYSQPTEAGSGGGGESPYSIGGSGGGVIELTVSGTLAVNGTISANGGNGAGAGGGGGAGGSLDLSVGSFTGSGLISANGGSGYSNVGGGGGGGMVAINIEQGTFSNLFNGTISAYGGGGATNGGAGTIFIRTNITERAELILDNGGNLGTNTPINTGSSLYSLEVANGAIASVSQGTFLSLLITSNAWIVPPTSQGVPGRVSLEFYSGATIQAGGGIIADFYGSQQGTGTGHGSSIGISPSYPCSGAGHGGDGAFGLSNLVAGGITYDSIAQPEIAGSGGGDFLPYSTGGAGGGVIAISVGVGQGFGVVDPSAGVLQVDGIISANGGNGSGIGGGGGSGGSISLEAYAVKGVGSITANGGNGAPNGGGGGGGCILVYSPTILPVRAIYETNLFHGTISAYGGGGANYGGAGTLYYRTNNTLGIPIVYLDNDNNVGTNTTIIPGGMNVVIQNGAIGAIDSSSWSPDAVMVLSNSELTCIVGVTTVQASSLTIAAGGVFSVDGGGYTAGNGKGTGSASGGISGGGGHGGDGGGNLSGGGAANDSIQAPTSEGSGGAGSSYGSGGIGGGALTLEVTSNLVVNGRLSANGLPGGFNAGGGSGGSLYLERIPSLSGSGIISANGGAGSDSGGGGGGGRIAVTSSTNTFTGQYSAAGGGGASPGGAGTIFTTVGSGQIGGGQTLDINNGGLAGAGTPLSSAFAVPSTPFELDISGGASALPFTPLPLLSNLNVSASSTLAMPVAQSNFIISVMGNATIAGDLEADYLGYSQTNGPGAGVAVDDDGSGAGYGGAGGASDSGAPGGKTYGSRVEPTDFGSGGGNGADTATGGSSGGGALRLSVLGTLTVSGNVSANGDSGLQDDSGGGSGGSVWITAKMLSGAGTISAAGGDGVLYGGGGGGGGRIAIYALTNQFTGTTNVSAGLGIVSGQPGTVSLSTTLNSLQILSQSPTGLVVNTVSSMNLTFSDMLNPGSVLPSDFTLITPAGPLTQVLSVVTSPYSVQLNFPVQNINGTYTLQVATNITDMFGASLAQPFTGTFTISIPAISGAVTGTNGAGIAGVSIQAGGGLVAATDNNGNYSLGVPPGWSGTVTPSYGSCALIPGSLSYTNITSSLANQNYSMVQTISPTLATSVSAGNYSLNWNGISGVTYQVLWSTNLVTWQPLGSPLAGTNGPMQFALPSGSNSAAFFQIQAGD